MNDLFFGVFQLPLKYVEVSIKVINNICNDMSIIVKEAKEKER
jgi:hypothetical protein